MENILCNKRALTLFGMKSDKEFLERFYELSPIFQPDGQLRFEKAKKYVAKAFECGECDFKWLHFTLDGVEIPTIVTLRRIDLKDEEGNNLVVGAFRELEWKWEIALMATKVLKITFQI